jgi:hypothetical protein
MLNVGSYTCVKEDKLNFEGYQKRAAKIDAIHLCRRRFLDTKPGHVKRRQKHKRQHRGNRQAAHDRASTEKLYSRAVMPTVTANRFPFSRAKVDSALMLALKRPPKSTVVPPAALPYVWE